MRYKWHWPRVVFTSIITIKQWLCELLSLAYQMYCLGFMAYKGHTYTQTAQTHIHVHCILDKAILTEYGSAWMCHNFPCMNISEFIEIVTFINHHDVSVLIFLLTSAQTSTGDSSTTVFVWVCVFAFGPFYCYRPCACRCSPDSYFIWTSFKCTSLSTESQHQCIVWRWTFFSGDFINPVFTL